MRYGQISVKIEVEIDGALLTRSQRKPLSPRSHARIQHFGMTTPDLKKSLTFYIEPR